MAETGSASPRPEFYCLLSGFGVAVAADARGNPAGEQAAADPFRQARQPAKIISWVQQQAAVVARFIF